MLDRLAERHGLDNGDQCALCAQAPETTDHLLLLGCPYSREVWFKLLRASASQRLMPASDDLLADWWLNSRKRLPKELHKGYDTMVVIVSWELWKE